MMPMRGCFRASGSRVRMWFADSVARAKGEVRGISDIVRDWR